MDERVTELEIRFTHQQATLESLNEVIVEQGRLIDALRAEIGQIRRRVEALGPPGLVPIDQSEKPPHH